MRPGWAHGYLGGPASYDLAWAALESCVLRPQGRFSGRLETKDDERLLAEECKHLGPLLGGVGKRGERARTTLAKIVRGIAAGDVRRYLESREQELGVSDRAGL